MADLALIDRWWERWPGANVAVITGRLSGVVVIDVDTRHEGEWSLEDLQAEHGPIPWRAVVNRLRRLACLLAAPAVPGRQQRKQARRRRRCPGGPGLALLPPSRRHLDAYRWEVGGPDTVPVMPNGWRRLLRPPRPRPPAPPHVWSEPGEGRDAARLAGLVRQVAQAPERRRNNTLYWVGKRLAEMVPQGAPPAWRAELERAGLDAGLEVREVAETLDSALGEQS